MDGDVSFDDEVTLRDGERYYESFSDRFAEVRGPLVTIDRVNDDDDRPFGTSSDPGPSRHKSVLRE